MSGPKWSKEFHTRVNCLVRDLVCAICFFVRVRVLVLVWRARACVCVCVRACVRAREFVREGAALLSQPSSKYHAYPLRGCFYLR